MGCENKISAELSDIIISGSDTEYDMVTELANSYQETQDVKIKVKIGGSSKGVDDLINNKSQIANCSRDLLGYELELAENKEVNLTPIIIAVDAIAFVTHPNNPVDSLSTLQLAKILSGDVVNWKELGGHDKKIVLHGRDKFSGTKEFLKGRFLPNQQFPSSTVEHANNQDIINSVKNDPYGIGYVGAGFLMDKNGRPNNEIWALYLFTEGDSEAYSPYQYQAVNNESYPVIRPLYQVFDGVPTGKIEEFLNYELSDIGQAHIRENGFFPITSYYNYLNSKYIKVD